MSRAARLDLRPLAAAALRALVRERHALAPADEDRLVAYLIEQGIDAQRDLIED